MTPNLREPAFLQNPYPIYAEMRRQNAPLAVNNPFSGTISYFVSRYEHVQFVLRDPRFSVNITRLLPPDAPKWTDKWYMPSMLKVFADTMALKDEPDHTRLRGLVHKAFTPAMIQQLHAKIETLSAALLDEMAHKQVVDFIDAFALPLPLTIIADMMGVSQSDRQRFRRWMSNSITEFNPKDLIGAIPKLLNAFGLNGLFRRLIAERRAVPRDDLTTALVQAEEAGDKLTESELVAMLFLILFAGHETTVNLIGSGTLALLQHPDQWALLKATPALLDSAIEELLRYTNPIQHVAYRYPLEDVQIGETLIPRGTEIIVGIGAANRDETVFPNPDQLDITRSPNRHVAFGFGVHYCLGAPLARMEAKIAFGALIERFPNMALAAPAADLKWKGGPPLRGLVALPIRPHGG